MKILYLLVYKSKDTVFIYYYLISLISSGTVATHGLGEKFYTSKETNLHWISLLTEDAK